MRGPSAIKRRRVVRIARIRAMLRDKHLHLGPLVANPAQRLMQIEANLLVPLRRAPNRCLGDVIPAHAVPQHHIERRRRAALFAIRGDAHAAQVRPAEQQAFDLVAVAVVVEMDGAVAGEEGVEVLMRERVRMAAFVLEDQQVRHVDDAHAQARREFAEHGGRFDDFEGEFGADADNHDIRIETVVCAREFPDRSACAAMAVGFVWG